MSETEGIGGKQRVTSIKRASEAEVRAIYEEFEEVVQPAGGAGRRIRIHPAIDGEALCTRAGERHNAEGWSKPKPIAAFPISEEGEPYRPICSYCVQLWRVSGVTEEEQS